MHFPSWHLCLNIVSIYFLTVSFFSTLFFGGREDSLSSAIFGFCLIVVVCIYGIACRPVPLLELWAPFQRVGRACKRLGAFLLVMAFISFIVVMALWPRGNAPPYDDLAIFANRPEYALKKGADGYVTVSRFRFISAALSMQIAWHSAAVGAVLCIQFGLCCGFPRRNNQPDNQKEQTS